MVNLCGRLTHTWINQTWHSNPRSPQNTCALYSSKQDWYNRFHVCPIRVPCEQKWYSLSISKQDCFLLLGLSWLELTVLSIYQNRLTGSASLQMWHEGAEYVLTLIIEVYPQKDRVKLWPVWELKLWITGKSLLFYPLSYKAKSKS